MSKRQSYTKGGIKLALEKATQIPLEVWQDPQGDVILNVSERQCNVYFGCWNDDSTPANYIAKITFESCVATKYMHSEFVEYKVDEHIYSSYIFKVLNSSWLNEITIQKKTRYPNSHYADDYSHYVVKGHDVMVEVIAKGFSLERQSREQAGEYVRLIDEA